MASSVSADPPNARRSTSTIWCSVAPSFSATRRAAASSTACRWPYRKLSACAWYPSWIAIASTVAESSPPLSSTTAFATPTPYSIVSRARRALRTHLIRQDGAVRRAGAAHRTGPGAAGRDRLRRLPPGVPVPGHRDFQDDAHGDGRDPARDDRRRRAGAKAGAGGVRPAGPPAPGPRRDRARRRRYRRLRQGVARRLDARPGG